MPENGMTEPIDSCPRKVEMIDGRNTEVTSDFTKTDKQAPNLGTFYFRHEDTDSDMDQVEQHCNIPKADGQSTLDETSEDDWTYTRSVEQDAQTSNYKETPQDNQELHILKTKPIPEDTIRRLVQEAEELVSPEKLRRNSMNKLARVNKWLSHEKSEDSCDASAEEDEQESQASGGFDASTTTIREAQLSNSQNLENDSSDDHEVGYNHKAWLRSSDCKISEMANSTVINNFSTSESAIHKMNFSSPRLDRPTASGSIFTSNNSTSSTIEEMSPQATEKTSPLRRKKSKLRKKNVFGKSDTHLLCSPAQKNRNQLIKSGSFSEYSTRFTNNEQPHSSSDPATVHMVENKPFRDNMSTTSGADSEEEYNRSMGSHKYGMKMRHLLGSDLRDSSPGMSSLNAAEEQSSSLFEQAWDNYQENYLSEAYSESHDSDAAKRLLNFGEDYSKFIDSQSDWSALSDMSPTFKRKSWSVQNEDDGSNSDEESLKQLIHNSQEQLTNAKQIYIMVQGTEERLPMTKELEDLMATCERFVSVMSTMTDSSEEYKMSVKDKVVTTGLLGQWRVLKMKTAKLLHYKTIQKQIMDFKVFIKSINTTDKMNGYSPNFPVENILDEIDACNVQLEAIAIQRLKLTTLNANVHRFTVENQNSEDFRDNTLKADISELYELLDDARTCTTDKLCQMESLLPAWKTLESRLDQLQKDLREDEKTIHLLDSCLLNGTFNGQTASSLRDVAKVLSENTVHQGYHSLQEILTEGSFSDSGISDEGSEHEIGERQGRLAAIRRLVRQLEVSLSPDCKARQLMREKLNAAEEELKALQTRCKSLIVKTAACSAASPERFSLQQQQSSKDKKEPVGTELVAMKSKSKGRDPGGDPGDDPASNSFFKRMFKVSLAFQLVILTFVCLSCLYEPQCCDYMNNYSWSISPKLHYEGRPPI